MSRKINIRVYLVAIILSSAISISFGANPSGIVSAKVDTNQIRIGEQFILELNAKTAPGKEIIFPILPDTFNHFEVVGRGPIDTVPQSNPLTLRQQYAITSFDSGFFVLPPLPFLVRNLNVQTADTMSTEAMLIGVRTIAVDTTKEIRDIKPLMEVTYPWQELLPYIFGAIIVIATVIYFAVRFSMRKKAKVIAPPKPKTPAHLRALETLKNIEEQKLWQSGYSKKYHIEVSDTLRSYIEERFDIRAMEQTSDETLAMFRGKLIDSNQKEKLQYVLQLADMVKFAKSEPIAHENEQSILYAYDFVRSTVPQIINEDANKDKEAMR